MPPVRRTVSLLAPVALAAGALAAAPAARAQDVPPRDARGEPDSLPARAGTYALEGGVGVNSTSFGALRFLSPRSALGATLTANYSHTSGDGNAFTNAGANATFGYRRYGRLRGRVAGFGTVGLTGGYGYYRQTQQDSYRVTYRTTDVGGFGEFGAAYLVARRLTVNASASATLTGQFTRQTNEQPTPSGVATARLHQNGLGAALGPVRFGLTLFL